MIARLLMFAIASLASSVGLPNDLRLRVNLGDKHVLIAEYPFGIEALLESNLSTVVFRRFEYVAPYRDNNHPIDLQGEIGFEITGLPAITQRSLRFEYAPKFSLLNWSDPNWKIHPEDAASIALQLEADAKSSDFDQFILKYNDLDYFRGVLFENPSHDTFSAILSQARVMTVGKASRNYIYPNLKDHDLTFTGDIEISFNGLPPKQLSSLRLVYTPNEEQIFYTEKKGWKLNPDDAGRIVSQYRSIIRQQQSDALLRPWGGSLSVAARLIVLLLLFWLLSYVVRTRIARRLHSRSVDAVPEARWWDE